VDFQGREQRCAGLPRVVNRQVAAGLIASSIKAPVEGPWIDRRPVVTVNTMRTAHSGEVGSRLLATVRAEMTSSNSGTPDNPAGVA
jgi:hypothetical protein